MMDYHFIHLLIEDNEIHSTLLIDSIVLNFPEETSWSTQALMCILILFYHVRTMFSCVDFGIHLLSLRQCLLRRVSHRDTRSPLGRKFWRWNGTILREASCFQGVWLISMKKSLYYSPRGIVVGFMNLSSNHSRLGPLGNESEALMIWTLSAL